MFPVLIQGKAVAQEMCTQLLLPSSHSKHMKKHPFPSLPLSSLSIYLSSPIPPSCNLLCCHSAYTLLVSWHMPGSAYKLSAVIGKQQLGLLAGEGGKAGPEFCSVFEGEDRAGRREGGQGRATLVPTPV